MNSSILKVMTRILFPMLVACSLFYLWVGHHAPGGGFIAGLIFSSGLALRRFNGMSHRFSPLSFITVGLFIALVSVTWSLAAGSAPMVGTWTRVPGLGELGTPMLFDSGVFLVVIGISQTFFTQLDEYAR